MEQKNVTFLNKFPEITSFLTIFVENDTFLGSEQNFGYWSDRFFVHMENYDTGQKNSPELIFFTFRDVFETQIWDYFEAIQQPIDEKQQNIKNMFFGANECQFTCETDQVVWAWIGQNTQILLEKLALHASAVIELPLQIRDNLFRITDLVTVLEQSPTVHLASMFGTEGYLEECYVEDWGFDESDLILDVVNQNNIFFNKQQFIDLLRNSGKTLVFFSYDDETGNCPMILF